MNRILFLLCLVILIGSACTEKKASISSVRIDSLMNTAPDFSGVLLIADKGVPAYFKSFGFLDFNLETPLDTTAIFELASVSKQFTAMSVMMLEQEGKLSYDDSLRKFIPELPYAGITIRHLLNHTSGLPDYQSVMDQNWDKLKVAGNPDCIEYLARYHPPILFAPGSKYEYSNTGYLLLATVVEETSGIDFIELACQRIFRPVGMAATDIRTKEEKLKLKNFAWGHIYVAEENQFVAADSFPSANYTIWLGNRKGPGRISSTASDLLKWDQALYSSRLVSEKTLTEAFSPARLTNDSLSNYGFGWTIQVSKIGRVVRHSGDNPGYKTHIVRYIGVNKTIILLCNNAHPRFNDLLLGIETLVTGQ